MSDGITDAKQDEMKVIEKWREDELHQYLKIISTHNLVDELCKRDGVTVETYSDFKHIVVRE